MCENQCRPHLCSRQYRTERIEQCLHCCELRCIFWSSPCPREISTGPNSSRGVSVSVYSRILCLRNCHKRSIWNQLRWLFCTRTRKAKEKKCRFCEIHFCMFFFVWTPDETMLGISSSHSESNATLEYTRNRPRRAYEDGWYIFSWVSFSTLLSTRDFFSGHPTSIWSQKPKKKVGSTFHVGCFYLIGSACRLPNPPQFPD